MVELAVHSAAAAATTDGNPAYTLLILAVLIGLITWAILSTRARREKRARPKKRDIPSPTLTAVLPPSQARRDSPPIRPQAAAIPRLAGRPAAAPDALTADAAGPRRADAAGPRPSDPPASHGPVPGSQIAGYLLVEQVGRGGMAVVFKAEDKRLGRQAALKVLAPALADDHAFRQRFIRESRAAAALDDPHIIPVYQAGQADGVLFIAMRYVSGGDVRTMLDRDGPMTLPRAVSIISPIASALDTAHAAGLVHRDVKPANMLIDTRPRRSDHVYLSDFGLAKSTATVASLTGTGQFLGTLDYISPEQIEGKPVDGRTDQYALACATFELLTGVPPFRRNDAAAIMYAHISEPPPNVTSQRAGLPAATDTAIAKALAKSPDGRFPTCTDFADALRAAAGIPAYQPEPAATPAPHPPTQIA